MTETHVKPRRRAAHIRRRVRARYIPALDGLRAFAVLAVIAYHMGVGWAPGGLMGVTVFFVISGYLINGLLVSEREHTGRISLSQFWLRRVRRIIPAVLLAVAGTVALCALISPPLLEKARPDILPSLLFFNNWWQVFHEVSYFEAAGAPSPLTHFWSLAIEEQFYIVWPLLLVAMYRFNVKKRSMAAIVGVLAVLSAAEMAFLYSPASDPSRAYYGTDTRAMSLLLGVWLAFVWPSAAFGGKAKTQRNRTVWTAFNVAGAAAFAGLVFIVATTSGFSPFPYRGGIALVSVLSAVLIAVLVVPDTWMSRLFELSPLVWIGKRSYGMYLWHYPIILLTSRVSSTVDVPWWVRLSQLIVIFAISDLSYRFVEDPIRKGALGEWWRNRGSKQAVDPKARLRAIATTAAVCVVFVGAIAGNALVSPPDANKVAGSIVRSTIAEVKSTARLKAEEAGISLGSSDGGGARQDSAAGKADASGSSGQSSQAASLAAAETEDEQSLVAQTIDSVRASIEENGIAEKLVVPSVVARVKEHLPDPSPVKRTIDMVLERGAEERERIVSAAYSEAFDTPRTNSKGKPVYTPLLIGDSVSAGCIDEFLRVFPNGCIDAVPNRNIWESPYATYEDAGQVGDYVVFCLGTNNAVEDYQIDELLAGVPDDKKVIFVNTREPRDWEATTNAAIERAPERHDQVVAVVDWYHESAGHDEYFYDDGIHLTNTGPAAYIGLIRDALEKAAIEDALAKHGVGTGR